MRKSFKAKARLIMDSSNQERLNRIKENAIKTSYRISRMIIFNQLNFVLLRFQLAILSFYGFIFKYDTELKIHSPDLFSYIICKNKKFCISVGEIFVCFYLTSFLIQFLTFYKLDKNFKVRHILR